jgi:hypothetical protein
MVVNVANMLHLIQFVKVYFTNFHLSSPITGMFSQIPNRIEMIAQVEIHEEHAILYDSPAESQPISRGLSWICRPVLTGAWEHGCGWLGHIQELRDDPSRRI